MNFHGKVIVITGPTGTGKSDIAVKIAKKLDTIIINADSRQIYEEVGIGTAKPSPDRIDGDMWVIDDVPHYLYGHVSIFDKYDIARYQKDVQTVFDQYQDKSSVLLVGGTGLYIDAIIKNYKLDSEPLHSEASIYEEKDIEKLHSMIEPDILAKLNNSDLHNPLRLQRIIARGGALPSKPQPAFDYMYFVLDAPNEDYYKTQIRQRVEKMLRSGLISEVADLRQLADDRAYPPIIGYREFAEYQDLPDIDDDVVKQITDDIVIHTLQYAKRQRTWFRREPEAQFFTDPAELLAASR